MTIDAPSVRRGHSEQFKKLRQLEDRARRDGERLESMALQARAQLLADFGHSMHEILARGKASVDVLEMANDWSAACLDALMERPTECALGRYYGTLDVLISLDAGGFGS